MHGLSEPDSPCNTLEERHTVGVQALVDRRSAGLGAGKGNTRGGLRGELRLVTLAEVLDDGGLHRELDPVEGDEPDDVPDPDDTDPSTADALHLGEAPVTVRSDDRRDELSDAEGDEERSAGPLHEEEAVRTSDEDEGLRDDGDLEVDDHMELRVVGDDRARGEGKAELVLEEGRLDDDVDEGDAR